MGVDMTWQRVGKMQPESPLQLSRYFSSPTIIIIVKFFAIFTVTNYQSITTTTAMKTTTILTSFSSGLAKWAQEEPVSNEGGENYAGHHHQDDPHTGWTR